MPNSVGASTDTALPDGYASRMGLVTVDHRHQLPGGEGESGISVLAPDRPVSPPTPPRAG
ncbi:hypothetical protein ALMP_82220 [Streptomyces sp. A012304]|nr:hypothetical protein ALMP_82220 [Streptomyces sp. A012304]